MENPIRVLQIVGALGTFLLVATAFTGWFPGSSQRDEGLALAVEREAPAQDQARFLAMAPAEHTAAARAAIERGDGYEATRHLNALPHDAGAEVAVLRARVDLLEAAHGRTQQELDRAARPRSDTAWPASELGSPGGNVYVRGYYRRDGTYVHPHTRRRH